MISIIVWILILSFSIIVSTFLHELGHGISSYLYGYRVSTGFNKVGDYKKKPSQADFRLEHAEHKSILFDLGVPITLLLGLSFSYLLRYVESVELVMIITAMAYVNGLLRLMPCIHALWGLKRGKLNMEDEVGLGVTLKEKLNIPLIEYLPLLMSLSVSLYILKTTVNLLSLKSNFSVESDWFLLATVIAAYMICYKLLKWLDENVRINWAAKIK